MTSDNGFVIIPLKDWYIDYDGKAINTPYICKGTWTFIAISGSKIIGYICVGRHSPNSPNSHRSRHSITSFGTYVQPRFRKSGVGKRLWKTMLSHLCPKVVYVTVVSCRGLTLIESLAKELPYIKWNISGQCGLRNLKRQKT